MLRLDDGEAHVPVVPIPKSIRDLPVGEKEPHQVALPRAGLGAVVKFGVEFWSGGFHVGFSPQSQERSRCVPETRPDEPIRAGPDFDD